MERARRLLEIIQGGLLKMQDPRIDSNIHATNLIDFCPREYLLCRQHKLAYNDASKVSISRIITFYVGHAVEGAMIQALKASKVARPIEPFYIQVTPQDKVVGTPDAAAIIDDSMPYIIEMKTTGKDEIDTMVEPYINHVCQLSLYLWMAEVRKQRFHTDVGFVVYVSKLEKKDQIKIFLVHKNDAFIQSVRNNLNIVKTFSKQDKLPNRICNSKIALMAKRCGVCSLCFGE